MNVRFSTVDGVVVLEYERVVVDDDDSFEAWSQQVLDGMQRKYEELGGRYLLAVGLDGLQLSRAYGERYSAEIATPTVTNFVTAIARYGRGGKTRAVIAIEAHNRVNRGDTLARDERFAANLFADRDEAIDFLRNVTK